MHTVCHDGARGERYKGGLVCVCWPRTALALGTGGDGASYAAACFGWLARVKQVVAIDEAVGGASVAVVCLTNEAVRRHWALGDVVERVHIYVDSELAPMWRGLAHLSAGVPLRRRDNERGTFCVSVVEGHADTVEDNVARRKSASDPRTLHPEFGERCGEVVVLKQRRQREELGREEDVDAKMLALEVEPVAMRAADVRVSGNRRNQTAVLIAIHLQSEHPKTIRSPSNGVKTNVVAGRIGGKGCLLYALRSCSFTGDD
eukprot:7378562-Prymnesium_polylepis.2